MAIAWVKRVELLDNKQTAVKYEEARDLGLTGDVKAFMGTQPFISSHTKNRVDIDN